MLSSFAMELIITYVFKAVKHIRDLFSVVLINLVLPTNFGRQA